MVGGSRFFMSLSGGGVTKLHLETIHPLVDTAHGLVPYSKNAVSSIKLAWGRHLACVTVNRSSVEWSLKCHQGLPDADAADVTQDVLRRVSPAMSERSERSGRISGILIGAVYVAKSRVLARIRQEIEHIE